MGRVVDARHAEAAAGVRERLALYDEHRDLVALGAHQPGRDLKLDDAISSYAVIERALRQRRTETTDWDQSVARLLTLARPH
jgi:flagellum-specific ATP synthase